ncbi:hypothetical protein An02g05330 [Aspergillus niger]|uniref:Uncharacterized protein n=2 Tax=Aspergillus niger TaxID=5061 RepID=A2QCZ9_ASPNC|nr:hypothetical protein An02g05330 [Aspergillus niger]CAK37639.1 hypothetical protein An02g05330 [Aspergillus niger]
MRQGPQTVEGIHARGPLLVVTAILTGKYHCLPWLGIVQRHRLTGRHGVEWREIAGRPSCAEPAICRGPTRGWQMQASAKHAGGLKSELRAQTGLCVMENMDADLTLTGDFRGGDPSRNTCGPSLSFAHNGILESLRNQLHCTVYFVISREFQVNFLSLSLGRVCSNSQQGTTLNPGTPEGSPRSIQLPHPVTSSMAPITQNELDICLDPLSQRPNMIYFVPSRAFHATSDIPEATGRTQQLRPRTEPGAKTEGMCVMIDYCRSDPIPRQARKEATVGRNWGAIMLMRQGFSAERVNATSSTAELGLQLDYLRGIR